MNKQAVLKLNLQVVLLVILCTGRFLIFGQTDTWVQKANYGGGSTFSGIGFSIGDKGYIGLGDNASGTQFQQIWEYDPTTNVWTQKADFGGGTRSNAVAFSIGGKAYVGTGYNSVPQKDFWEYDQASNTWTQMADFAGGNRIRMVGFSIGTKGYVGTGSNGTFFKDFWEYNPATDTWTALPDFPGLPRQSATGFSVGLKGYIGTGWGTSSNFKDFWEYDPLSNTWLQKADVGTTNRYEAVGFSIGSKGYISTGGEWPVYTKDLLEYDPSIDCWTKRADFGGAVRALASGFAVGGKGYVGTSNFTIDFWEYTPAPSLPPPTISSFTPSSGALGTSVTIMGTNFDPAPTNNIVKFNNTIGVISASSSTSITVTVPDGATTGPIQVTVGCNSVLTTTNFTPIVPENSILFNGTNQEAQLGNWFNYQNFTISLWVKPGATQVQWADILDNNHSGAGSFVLQQFSNNTNQYYFGGAGTAFPVVQTFDLAPNAWQHVTLVSTSTQKMVYVNGCLITSQTGTTITYPGTQFLRLGNWGSGGRNWNGEMDEVKIYDRAFSASEVLAAVYTQESPAAANLLAYYKMNQSGGPTLVDSSPNAHTGTSINSPSFQTSTIPTVAPLPPTISSFIPSLGFLGVSVTITGINFDPVPSNNIVKFNGTTAVVTASTATSITVTVPNGATTGPVSVATGCNAAISTTNFTVTPYMPSGNVITFSGASDKVSVPFPPTTSVDNFTMEALINPSILPFPSWGAAVSNGADNGIAGNGISFGIGDGGSGGSSLTILYGSIEFFKTNFVFPTANTWYHVAIVRSGGVMTAYVNGNVVTPTRLTTPLLPTAFTIGNQNAINRPFNGKVDEVRIWNVARTQADIQSTLNSTLAGNETGLVAYYTLDETGQGAGITALNSATTTGAALNGTTVGTSCTPIFTLVNAPTITSFNPVFGSSGQSVTISGTNFDPTPANNIVMFNGTTAVVTASTATSITATIPSGGTSGLITVQTGCNTATSASNFIVPVCFPANGQNADVVLGQTNFTTNTSGNSNNKFAGVGSIAIHHTTGKVFVADIGNNRILRFSADQANTIGGIAEAVIGQPDFTTTSAGLSQTKLNLPIAIAMDQSSGALWVADANNNRVLRFDDAANIATGAPANGVLGQPGFTTSAATPSATNVGFPWGVVIDSNGDLWVGERAWNRVTKFANAASLANGAAATVVIGQTNFAATFGGTSTVKLDRPNNVAIDASGNLWVADELNDRVLKFPDAKTLSTGAAATVVLGQLDFFGNSFATAQNRMFGPIGLHADMFGNLWVGDWANHRTLQFVNAASLNNGANASRVLGSPNFTAITSGVTQSITAYIPGLAVDNFGNVFIADDLNRRVVRFNTPTATAPNTSVCSGSTATLVATGANIVQEYRWYDVPSGGTSLSSSASFATPPLTTNTTYYVSLFDGGCSYESVRTAVAASITSAAVAPSTVAASACGPSASLTVSASGGVNSQYRWYTAASGGTALTGEVNDTYTTPAITTTTSYYVSIDDGTCESARTEVIAQIDPLPAAPVVVGASDFAPAIVTLKASGGSNGQYRWHTASTGGTALASEVNDSFTTPFITVTTTYYVSINNGQCESARIPVVAGIKINSAPEILSTTASTTVAGRISLPLTTLISDPEDNLDFSTLAITKQPISGARATIDQQYNLDLDYSGISFAGTDRLSISICDELAACSEKELSIEVNGEITVFNALSANGDNKNVVFYLENIETLPDTKENKVTIFNRWGDVVFEVENYDNTDNVFRGINSSGNDLPAGTYFYRIKFASGLEEKTGFIALRK